MQEEGGVFLDEPVQGQVVRQVALEVVRQAASVALVNPHIVGSFCTQVPRNHSHQLTQIMARNGYCLVLLRV